MILKNPKECFCLQQRQTFFVLNELTAPECKDGSEPLTLHHNTFSRFKFVIINADKKATTSNIPVSAIPEILETVKMKNFSRFMPMPVQDKKVSDTEDLSNSIAYTTIISAGTLKGKSPAGALLENPNANKKMLLNQVDWLQKHLAQYPRNQVQIDAINEALRLFDAGKLTTQSAPSQPVERTDNEIYKSGMRPLIRRKNKNGKTCVYERKISWIPGSEQPVEIEIKNYFAPFVKRENGLLNVMAKEKEEEIKNVFPLTINEWLWLDHILNAQMRTFEDMNAARLYKIAKDEEWANKSAATAQPSSH